MHARGCWKAERNLNASRPTGCIIPAHIAADELGDNMKKCRFIFKLMVFTVLACDVWISLFFFCRPLSAFGQDAVPQSLRLI